MKSSLHQAAERVVEEIKRDMDPDKDSEYDLRPYPDPVGALMEFAEQITRSKS